MNSPIVSFIIPTLNAGNLLDLCLTSIRAQQYPQDKIEILVADGGSTDHTLQIANKHGAVILKNPDRVAESGKKIALKYSHGQIICFLDADNELTSPEILPLAVRGLENYPQTLGIESYYLASPRMSSFCQYMTETLHIGDPVSWFVSVQPLLVEKQIPFEIWTFPPGSMAYPLGANGFFYRCADLDKVGAVNDFEDTHVALKIAKSGKTTWLRLSRRGVHHYLVSGIWEFIQKRRRQTYHFLTLRKKNSGSESWTSQNPTCSPMAACLYCVSFFGPLFHTVKGLIRTGDKRWFWHMLACPASVLGLAWGVATYFLVRRTAESEAALQPKQKGPG